MDEQLKKSALEYHRQPRPGKISILPTKQLTNQRDLALAYSPGVAFPCEAIAADANDAALYTARQNLVAVLTNGTAVLGLGAIGPLAAKPTGAGNRNAALPNPDCLGGQTRERAAILAARKTITSECQKVTPAWQFVGATVQLAGVGYWNPVRSTKGALPNGAELRPVVVGQRHGDLVVIDKGVKPGERLVITGQLGVTPGGRVNVVRPTATENAPARPTPGAQS